MALIHNFRHMRIWGIFFLFLLLAPQLLDSASSLNMLSQTGIAVIFALSYNMLLGQGGMLSLGHAMYSGWATFCAIHWMNWMARQDSMFPVSLVPLVGGLAAMALAIIVGYLTTKKSGTTFAMITLGMAELVHAGTALFPDFFGGEAGVSSNRVIGAARFGIDFVSQMQVTYLIAFWLFVCALGMFAYTRTPLGRVLNAVRDNPLRAEFLGYDVRRVRYLTLIASAFFAGVAGGLSAVNFEIASAENLGAMRSAQVLLFCVIGGIAYFWGPVLGAVVGSLFTLVLPDYTRAWQLYLGVFFMLMVMCAPDGLAGVINRHAQLWRTDRYWHIVWPLAAVLVSAAALLAGISGVIEMLYQHSLGDPQHTTVTVLGVPLDDSVPADSLLLAGVLSIAVFAWRAAWRRYQCRFRQLQQIAAQDGASV